MFNFYFGDISDENNSYIFEFVKALLSAFLATITVLYGINYQHKKEAKRKLFEEKEKHQLNLFNLYQHIDALVKGKLQSDYFDKIVEYANKLKANPFSDEIFGLNPGLYDIKRVLEFTSSEFLASFVGLYNDKVQATKDYRILFNSVQMIKDVIEFNTKEYSGLIQSIYELKLNYKNATNEIHKYLVDITITYPNTEYTKLIIGILTEKKSMHEQYEKEGKPIVFEFMRDFLLEPTFDKLKIFENESHIKKVLFRVSDTFKLIDDIKYANIEIADFLLRNSKIIPENLKKCKEINDKIFEILPEKFK